MNRYAQSQAWFARASAVIPGGIYGHTSPAMTVPMEFPYFAQKAEGCRYWDVDGNEYLDLMCGYGPIVLGYQHAEVEEAASRQRAQGSCFNHPTPLMVELAERLVGLVDFADWAVFAKNGSDVTTWSLQVAREFTGRKKVLCVRGAYHGTHAWCTPGHGGLIEEDRAHIHTFEWNDCESVRRLFRKHRNRIAALITTPFHHPAFGENVLPTEEFLKVIREECTKHGVLWILDDIRAGFRLHMGGSHRFFGFEPDMICFCKALGNGYPISSALGRADYKVAASRVFLTGSYWNNAVPMAASLKTLEVLERDHVCQHLQSIGVQLAQGLEQAGKRHGWTVRVSGPPATPMMALLHDRSAEWMQRWSVECVKRGVWIHPHHNWFLCAAHQAKDIEKIIAVAEEAFGVLKES